MIISEVSLYPRKAILEFDCKLVLILTSEILIARNEFSNVYWYIYMLLSRANIDMPVLKKQIDNSFSFTQISVDNVLSIDIYSFEMHILG